MQGLLNARGGFDDPITMGLLGASQALLTPMSQGGGLGAAFGAFPAAQQAALKSKFLQQQMEDQQVDSRLKQLQVAAAIKKMSDETKALEYMTRRSAGWNPGAQDALQTEAQAGGQLGPTNSAAARMPTGGGGQQFPYSVDEVSMLTRMGIPGLWDQYKFFNTPQELRAGSVSIDRNTGQQRSNPNLEKGQVLRPDGSVGVAPGFLQALVDVVGTQEREKARYAPPFRIPTNDGREDLISPIEFADNRAPRFNTPAPSPAPARAGASSSAPTPANAFPRVNPSVQQDRDGTRLAILREEQDKAIRNGDPITAASVQRELDQMTGGGGVGKSTAVAQAEAIRAERAKAAANIDAKGAEGASNQASGARGVVMIADQIEKLIGDPSAPKVYGNAIPDRIAMGLNTVGGNETPKAVNTNQVRMLGQQMVLARGSLGAGVSVADADRYDKAAGDFSRAKTVPDMLAAVRTMRDIAKTYGSNEVSARQQLESGQSGNVLRYDPKTDTFKK